MVLQGYLEGEIGKARRFTGEHVKFDAVHKDDRENVQILNHVKTPDHSVHHLPHPGFVIEGFADRDMAVFFLVRLGLRL